jgi:hypothetical protein
MLTKVQYDYLKQDLVLAGVWDTIVKESPIIQRLPMKGVNNDIVKYNVEVTMPTVSWLQPGDQIVENTGTNEPRTTNLYTLIGDADTDKSMIAMNPLQNPETNDIEAKAKAMAHTFETCFILGQTTTLSNAKQFKGLLRMLAELESATTTDLDGINNSQVIVAAADSGAATMPLIDQLIDSIKPGKPDMLLMSRRARRKLNALARASGTSGLSPIKIEEFGLFMPAYDTIPIFVSDFIPDNIQNGASSVLTIASYDASVARTTNYDSTVIFALKVSEEDVTGLQAGGMTHERETFVEGYNVIRNRFSWNVSAMCKKKYSLAALINVNPDE